MADQKPIKRKSGKFAEFATTDTVPTQNLGTGTADGTTFLAGDQTWKANTSYEYLVTNTATNYTSTSTTGIEMIFVDATSGNITITLPTAVGNKTIFKVKKIDASLNTVSVATTGGETIDGNASPFVINFKNSLFEFMSDNTNYNIG